MNFIFDRLLEPVKIFNGHTGAVKKAIFMDAKRICTASDDKTIK
jgi:hypothetical protein